MRWRSALALPVLPFWSTAATPLTLALSAFVLQIFVQGAWGVVPVYLNELSPAAIRGTFPGFVYQAGNFLAAANANIQIWIAGHFDNNFGLTMALTVAAMAVVIAVLAASGPEPKGASMGADYYPRNSRNFVKRIDTEYCNPTQTKGDFKCRSWMYATQPALSTRQPKPPSPSASLTC